MTWLISMILASSFFGYGGTDSPAPGTALQAVGIQDETEQFSQTYPLNPNGKVSVSNVNGSITVESWDRNEVKLEATKIAGNKETLADVEIKVNSTPDRFEVETDYGNWNRGGGRKWEDRKIEVQYRLTVPRAAVLDEIETVNGSVTVKDLSNYVRASAVNGAVSGTNLRGFAQLSTVNGAVTADFDQLRSEGLIELSTVNGSASLVIPSDANATVKAESVNGMIKNDFGLPVRKGKYVGRDLYGKIGTGEVKIKLESVNGALSIMRKNDGKSPNTVTNLLPAKGSDDDDNEDFDDRFELDFSEFRRALETKVEITRRAIEQAAVASSEARADAVRAKTELQPLTEARLAELARIQPEIARINADALKAAAEAIDLAGIVPEVPEFAPAVLARLAVAGRAPRMEEKSGTFTVEGNASIRIETLNCPVFIRGWDKPEVRYSVSRVASELATFPIETDFRQESARVVQLKVINQDDSRGHFGFRSEDNVRLEIFVPRKSVLKIITNDEIRLEGVSGDIDLQGADGAINVRDSDGKLSLKSGDGLVRVIGFSGEFESQTADGDVFLEGDFTKIRSELNDGTMVLTLPAAADASVSSNSGSVAADGVDLVRKPGYNWLLGKGGRDYSFKMAGGKVIIRSVDRIKVS